MENIVCQLVASYNFNNAAISLETLGKCLVDLVLGGDKTYFKFK
jgi:hypothetical protein